MNAEILHGIGLNDGQVKAYIKLLQIGLSTPLQLSKLIGETRSNTYSILQKLEEYGLVKKDLQKPTIRYIVTNPVNLENFVERRRNVILNNEYKLNAIMPALVKKFYETTEQPEMQFFSGRDALHKIYEDIITTKKELYLIVSSVDHEFLGEKFISDFVKKRIARKIQCHALIPEGSNEHHINKYSKTRLIHRTYYDYSLYSSPVEINIYGDKVAYLSFGEEVIGTIIHSPQIAEAQRQLFKMLSLASQSVK